MSSMTGFYLLTYWFDKSIIIDYIATNAPKKHESKKTGTWVYSRPKKLGVYWSCYVLLFTDSLLR